MKEIRSFFASEQKIYNSLNKDLVVFALFFIHSFRVEHAVLITSFFRSQRVSAACNAIKNCFMLQLCVYRVMDALGDLGEHSRSQSSSPLCLEQLLRFSRALQTSRVTLSMEKFFKIDNYLILVFPTFYLFIFFSFRDRKIKMQVRVEMIRVREYITQFQLVRKHELQARLGLQTVIKTYYSSITSMVIISQRGNYDDNNIVANSPITP